VCFTPAPVSPPDGPFCLGRESEAVSVGAVGSHGCGGAGTLHRRARSSASTIRLMSARQAEQRHPLLPVVEAEHQLGAGSH
jgi:hypothetical protein